MRNFTFSVRGFWNKHNMASPVTKLFHREFFGDYQDPFGDLRLCQEWAISSHGSDITCSVVTQVLTQSFDSGGFWSDLRSSSSASRLCPPAQLIDYHAKNGTTVSQKRSSRDGRIPGCCFILSVATSSPYAQRHASCKRPLSDQ